MSARPRVLVLSLGGTIAMAQADGSDGVAPALDADDLLHQIPGFGETGAEVVATSFRSLPGAHLGIGDLTALAGAVDEALAADYDGVVVTQGTDTIEEIAFGLDLLTGEGPVVVTGAMRHSEAAGADGPANLIAAVQVAAAGATRGAGVTVVFGDEIHSAPLCRKAHTSRPAAFVSDPGPIGWVSEGVPRVLLAPRTRFRLPGIPRGDARVAVAAVGLGDDGGVLEALSGAGFDGLVIDALGGGHVPAAVADQIARWVESVPVVVASRARAGEVLRATYGFPGSEIDLLDRGVVTAGRLDAAKARVLLTLLLAGGADRAQVAEAFASFGGARRG